MDVTHGPIVDACSSRLRLPNREVLRRPLEPKQYVSIRYAERLAEEPDLHFNDEEIPREEKIAILSDAYRGFYFRPGRAIRIAKTMGNVHRVRRLAGAAKSIVFEGGFDI